MTREYRRRRTPLHGVLALATLGLTATSCDFPSDTEEIPPGANADKDIPSNVVTIHSELKPVSDNLEGAYTYDPELAPVNSWMQIISTTENDSTTVQLNVRGFLPNRGYASHVHTDHCGPTGDDAGPHFQHIVDPQATPDDPSRDPTYANPQNEIWLDFVTDDNGNSTTTARVPFNFTDPVTNTGRAPNSVVVHEAEDTLAGRPGPAGEAEGRIACLTVPFSS